jgi:hypothetical protein
MESPAIHERVKIYLGAVLKVKVRNGKEGAPVLAKVMEEPRQLLSGLEAVAFLEYLANNDLRDIWQKLSAPAETLRARCETALKTYRMIR